MYKYEYQCDDIGHSSYAVLDTDREIHSRVMCECDNPDDASLIVAALNYLQENSTG